MQGWNSIRNTKTLTRHNLNENLQAKSLNQEYKS